MNSCLIHARRHRGTHTQVLRRRGGRFASYFGEQAEGRGGNQGRREQPDEHSVCKPTREETSTATFVLLEKLEERANGFTPVALFCGPLQQASFLLVNDRPRILDAIAQPVSPFFPGGAGWGEISDVTWVASVGPALSDGVRLIVSQSSDKKPGLSLSRSALSEKM